MIWKHAIFIFMVMLLISQANASWVRNSNTTINMISNTYTNGTNIFEDITVNKSINFGNETTGVRNLMWYLSGAYGIPAADGFRIDYDFAFAAPNDDWLIFRKTDANDIQPDGGIAFVMTGSDGVNKTVLELFGNGEANFSENVTAKKFIGNGSKLNSIDSNNIDWKMTVNMSNSNVNLMNLNISGNMSVKRPYGMYSDNTTQTIAVAATAYPINFSTIEDDYLITKTGHNFTFKQTGDYLIEISAIVSVDLPNKHVELWVQKNGVNVPRSNTKVELSNAVTETVISVPFIIDMVQSDVMRLMWASDDAGSTMVYTPSTTYSPETPSIIMTITKISEITP